VERQQNFVAHDSVEMQANESCTYNIVTGATRTQIWNWPIAVQLCRPPERATSTSSDEQSEVDLLRPKARDRSRKSAWTLHRLGLFEYLGFQVNTKGAGAEQEEEEGCSGECGHGDSISRAGKPPCLRDWNSALPDFHELFRFKFQAKAKRFSGGNQGSYSLKWKDTDVPSARAHSA